MVAAMVVDLREPPLVRQVLDTTVEVYLVELLLIIGLEVCQ
jgi:hypothetical protein